MNSAIASSADLLRQLRTLAALSQEDLAVRAGLSLRGISDLERFSQELLGSNVACGETGGSHDLEITDDGRSYGHEALGLEQEESLWPLNPNAADGGLSTLSSQRSRRP